MDDHELLQEYVRNQSQEAFRQLVDRHLAMVISAARRMVQDVHLAEEVAQRVFATLAQKAGTLGPSPVVGGWLYNTTRHLAMHAVRTEQRRRQREQSAAAMQSQETNDHTEQILEYLEPSMAELEEGERDALVLRKLVDRSLREVGQELGISEDAARMRVNRALERLRGVFANRGVTATSILLATALAGSTTSAVPAGLAAAITATALAGTTAVAATTVTHAVLTTMFNAKIFTAVLTTAVLTGAGTYVVQQRQIQRLQTDNQTLLAQQAQANAAQDAAVGATQATKDELPRLQRDNAELLRLRDEVTRLHQQTSEVERLKAQNRRLRESLADTEAALKAAAPPPEPETDPFKKETIARLTLGKQVAVAFIIYANDHAEKAFPQSLDQVKAYFTTTGDHDAEGGGHQGVRAGPFRGGVERHVDEFQ